MRELHVQQFSDRDIPEPVKLLKRQEKFPPAKDKQEAMLRDVGDFNF